MEAIRKIFASLIFYGFLLLFLVLFLSDVIRLDEYLFFLINSSTNDFLLVFFNLITYLGSSLFWIFLIILFLLKDKEKLSLRLFYVFIIDTLSLFLLKQFFFRPRPLGVLQVTDFDIGPSFPSGHSQRAFSGAVILSNYYKKHRILFYALATLVSFSRIYIGFHYPLDALIGTINGIIIGMIALLIPTKKINSQKLSRLLGYKN
jgi:undecaprenyl-diphosphatase